MMRIELARFIFHFEHPPLLYLDHAGISDKPDAGRRPAKGERDASRFRDDHHGSRHDDHILLVTLNRPEASNALNTRMGLDLMEVFEALAIDLEDLRAVIVTGSGGKAFCAGGDLKERNGMTDESWQAQHAIFERMVRAMMGCPVPLIAAVNGAAYGGGCEIAAASDFVYAATNARFALTEVTLGIMPGTGGTQNLARAVGERRAKELILSGLPFTSAEAEAWGFVNRVVEPAELLESTLAIARRIAANGRSRSARPSRQFIGACRCRCGTAWRSRSRPTTAWSPPKTAAKACWRSTRSASRCSGGGEFQPSHSITTFTCTSIAF